MLLFSNAKINLGLRVIDKRSDGYHNIETVMMPVGLCDLLEFVEAGEDVPVLTNTGIQTGCEYKDNLVFKAWSLLKKDFNIPAVKIHLHKFIPQGAGLGGGSSNAAFMLKGLNDYFNIGLHSDKLEDYAAMLGSDCPFFIRNTPCLVTGKGEKLDNITLNTGFYLVLLHPGFAISTKDAYKGIVPGIEDRPLANIISEPPDKWADILFNQFEETVFPGYPGLAELKTGLYRRGAFYASMSGSGSSVYGLFINKPVLENGIQKMIIWEGVIK